VVLKYPFCTGEAEQIVLHAISSNFEGNGRTFVEQAEALGIKDIGSPAQTPLAQDAIDELNKLNFDALELGLQLRIPRRRGRSSRRIRRRQGHRDIRSESL
jgi:hypothetical protein